jgi:sulfur carrier protein
MSGGETNRVFENMTAAHISTARRLTLHLNGEAHETIARTLAELVAEVGLADAKVATACNGTFVPERARAELRLAPGDQVEIVSPRQGG